MVQPVRGAGLTECSLAIAAGGEKGPVEEEARQDEEHRDTGLRVIGDPAPRRPLDDREHRVGVPGSDSGSGDQGR